MATTSAGYSGTPLPRKLGLSEPQSALFINLPDGPLEELVGHVGTADCISTDGAVPGRDYSVVLVFVKERKALEAWLAPLMDLIQREGMIWVAWPKRASKVPTDVTEDVVREVALPLGLVDVKVCAVDPIWSGLKLVIRKELR
ncbi:MAG: DUF3052 domain-containing protein [Pseudomonadota bacterium]